MKLIKHLIFSLLIGLFLLAGSGCSVIGFGIGAWSDSNKIEDLEISSDIVPSITKNNHIQLLLNNGHKLEGQFLSYLEQTIETETIETIVWYDKINNRQVSTELAEIDRILISHQRNGKWLGLLLGAFLDVFIVVAYLKLNKIFEGFTFFNSPHCL